MTDDQMQTVREDIAYVRGLAESGRKAPLLGGSILIAAGLIFGAASIGAYALEVGLISAPEVAKAVIWLGALVLFLGVLALLNRRIGRKPGYFSPANKSTGAAWMGVGVSIAAMSAALGVISYRVGGDSMSLVFPPLIFALYGVGWAVSATMSDRRVLWWAAIGCWIATPLIALLSGRPEQYLAYAVGLILFAMLPGLALVRQEPAGAA